MLRPNPIKGQRQAERQAEHDPPGMAAQAFLLGKITAACRAALALIEDHGQTQYQPARDALWNWIEQVVNSECVGVYV